MSETRFFIELPEDEYGNIGHYIGFSGSNRPVIEAHVERFNDGYRDRERLHVIAPAEMAAKWPTLLRDVAGWQETEGPARLLTRAEWARLVGFTGNGGQS